MKQWIFILCFLSFFANLSAREVIVNGEVQQFYPIEWNMISSWVDQTNLTSFPNQSLQYSETETNFLIKLPINNCDGIVLGIGYANKKFSWNNNPAYKQSSFDNFILTLGGFTIRAENWLWKGGVKIEMNTKYWDLIDYTLYHFAFWGRYAYNDHLGLNIGFIDIAGLKNNRTYPVIGIDYTCERFNLDLVFPYNLKAFYHLPYYDLSAGIILRHWYTRQRAGKDEIIPRSIVEYRNWGIACAIQSTGRYIFLQAEAGAAIGGRADLYLPNGTFLQSSDLENALYLTFEAKMEF